MLNIFNIRKYLLFTIAEIHLQLDYNAKFFDSEYQIQFFGLGIIITIVPQIP